MKTHYSQEKNQDMKDTEGGGKGGSGPALSRKTSVYKEETEWIYVTSLDQD